MYMVLAHFSWYDNWYVNRNFWVLSILPSDVSCLYITKRFFSISLDYTIITFFRISWLLLSVYLFPYLLIIILGGGQDGHDTYFSLISCPVLVQLAEHQTKDSNILKCYMFLSEFLGLFIQNLSAGEEKETGGVYLVLPVSGRLHLLHVCAELLPLQCLTLVCFWR